MTEGGGSAPQGGSGPERPAGLADGAQNNDWLSRPCSRPWLTTSGMRRRGGFRSAAFLAFGFALRRRLVGTPGRGGQVLRGEPLLDQAEFALDALDLPLHGRV